MSYEESKRLEKIMMKEKPKGYIPPKKLIAKLKNDIKKSNNTYSNIIGIEKFFNSQENTNRKIIDSINSYSYSNKSRSTDNIYSNTNNVIPKKINNNLNNLYRILINNTNSSGTTDIFGTRKSSGKEPSKDYSNSNMSSFLSGRSIKFSPIISPFSNILYNNKYQFKGNLTNRLNRLNSSEIDTRYSYNTKPKTIDIPLIDINSKIKKNNLFNNKIKINILNGKTKLRKSESTHFDNGVNSIINKNKSEGCELIDSLNNLNNRNSFDQSITTSDLKLINNNDNKSKENDNININTNTHDKTVNFNFDKKEDKKSTIRRKSRIIKIKRNTKKQNSSIFKSKITKKEREYIKYRKLETLFNNAVKFGFNSEKTKSD